jgi:DNA-binding NtrC family response regulator
MATVRPQAARTVLVITSDRDLRNGFEEVLAAASLHAAHAPSAAEALAAANGMVDGVLVDLGAAPEISEEFAERLRDLRRVYPQAVIAAASMMPAGHDQNGASGLRFDEYFVLPDHFRSIGWVLAHAIENRVAEVESRARLAASSESDWFCEMLGRSDSMRRVYEAIRRVAQSTSSVVIRGESGTGKELVARAIVALGPRRTKPFISLNCAALPEALIEAELFGHEKGAFTGAHAARPGHIELAHGGTVFLDEIATLSPHLQSKLLRVLQSRTVQRLGSAASKQIDFRLLTATHENLEQMVQTGRFREDLFYRIHVVPIHLPPLRARKGDIAVLADHFLHHYCDEHHVAAKRIELDALEVLEDYGWPGNVRELENLIQRLVIMIEGPTITAEHLPQQILYNTTTHREALLIPDEGIDFDQEMERIEKAYVEAALRRTAGKKVAAAALLQVNPQKMKYLCRKHGITKLDEPDVEPAETLVDKRPGDPKVKNSPR